MGQGSRRDLTFLHNPFVKDFFARDPPVHTDVVARVAKVAMQPLGRANFFVKQDVQSSGNRQLDLNLKVQVGLVVVEHFDVVTALQIGRQPLVREPRVLVQRAVDVRKRIFSHAAVDNRAIVKRSIALLDTGSDKTGQTCPENTCLFHRQVLQIELQVNRLTRRPNPFAGSRRGPICGRVAASVAEHRSHQWSCSGSGTCLVVVRGATMPSGPWSSTTATV